MRKEQDLAKPSHLMFFHPKLTLSVVVEGELGSELGGVPPEKVKETTVYQNRYVCLSNDP